MKIKILKQLRQIAKLAKANKITGKLYLEFEGYSEEEYDNAIDAINEFPKYKHIFSVSHNLDVYVILN
jgi:hypothetical protein